MDDGSCPEVATRQSGCGIHTLLLNRHALRRIGRFNVSFSMIVLKNLRNMKKQIGSIVQIKITRANPQNNTKHGKDHADHEEAQAGDQAAAVEDQ